MENGGDSSNGANGVDGLDWFVAAPGASVGVVVRVGASWLVLVAANILCFKVAQPTLDLCVVASFNWALLRANLRGLYVVLLDGVAWATGTSGSKGSAGGDGRAGADGVACAIGTDGADGDDCAACSNADGEGAGGGGGGSPGGVVVDVVVGSCGDGGGGACAAWVSAKTARLKLAIWSTACCMWFMLLADLSKLYGPATHCLFVWPMISCMPCTLGNATSPCCWRLIIPVVNTWRTSLGLMCR